MPVHVLTETIADRSLGNIVRGWKAFSAAMINQATGARGAFWARDYFDRYMRSEDDLERTIDYVEHNPVVARLCPGDWPWSSARLKEP